MVLDQGADDVLRAPLREAVPPAGNVAKINSRRESSSKPSRAGSDLKEGSDELRLPSCSRPPSTGASPAVSFPAPTLAAVLAGTTVLAERQKGDAVLSLQNALIKLGYLPLTDKVKSGLGNFGPKTYDALVEFQHDVCRTGDGKRDAQTFLAISQILSESIKRGNHNHVGIVCRLHDRIVARKLLTAAGAATATAISVSSSWARYRDFSSRRASRPTAC